MIILEHRFHTLSPTESPRFSKKKFMLESHKRSNNGRKGYNKCYPIVAIGKRAAEIRLPYRTQWEHEENAASSEIHCERSGGGGKQRKGAELGGMLGFHARVCSVRG